MASICTVIMTGKVPGAGNIFRAHVWLTDLAAATNVAPEYLPCACGAYRLGNFPSRPSALVPVRAWGLQVGNLPTFLQFDGLRARVGLTTGVSFGNSE